MCTSLVFTHHIPLARSLSLLPAPTVQIGLLPLVPSDRRGPVSAERVGHREKYFSIVHHHRRSRYFSLWVMGRMFRCRCRVNIVAQLHFSNARQVHVLVLNMLPQFKRRGIPILATPNEFAARTCCSAAYPRKFCMQRRPGVCQMFDTLRSKLRGTVGSLNERP